MSDVVISPGNSKLGNIPNVSLTPVISCGSFCDCRSKLCYAKRVYARYPSVRKAWDNNLTLAITDQFHYFYCISDWFKAKRPKHFRWHVGGDILGQGYLESMFVIAQDNPGTKFLCFTKRYRLDYGNKPDNLNIVFSAWPQFPLVRSHLARSFPVAWMQDGTETRIPDSAKECPGKCHDCHECWNLKPGESVFFHKH